MDALESLKRRCPGADDALLTDLLASAANYILGYTGRSSLPDCLTQLKVEVATIYYSRMGKEGIASYSAGGVSQAYYAGVEDMPKSITNQLNFYRLAKVGGKRFGGDADVSPGDKVQG